MKKKRMNTLKIQEDISAELKKMNNSPIDYSDVPPMTEEESKTAQFYYKDFLNKLPQEMVHDMVQQRLSEVNTTSQNEVGVLETVVK